MDNPIEIAAKAAGGMAKLASSLGLDIQVVSNWKTRGAVPVTYCIAVERLTGVDRRKLRPKDGKTIWPVEEAPVSTKAKAA